MAVTFFEESRTTTPTVPTVSSAAPLEPVASQNPARPGSMSPGGKITAPTQTRDASTAPMPSGHVTAELPRTGAQSTGGLLALLMTALGLALIAGRRSLAQR